MLAGDERERERGERILVDRMWIVQTAASDWAIEECPEPWANVYLAVIRGYVGTYMCV